MTSFAVIATAMSLILINEYVGIGIIESLIPSFYSGVLLVGATVYGASPAALITLVVSIGALIFYLYFIFRPAQEIVAKKSLILKRMQADGLSRFLRRNQTPVGVEGTPPSFSQYCHGLQSFLSNSVVRMRVIKNELAALVIYFSDKESSNNKWRDKLAMFTWQAMNTPCTSQGRLPQDHFPSPLSSNSKKGYRPSLDSVDNLSRQVSLQNLDENNVSRGVSRRNLMRGRSGKFVRQKSMFSIIRDNGSKKVEIPDFILKMKEDNLDNWMNVKLKERGLAGILESDLGHQLVISERASKNHTR